MKNNNIYLAFVLQKQMVFVEKQREDIIARILKKRSPDNLITRFRGKIIAVTTSFENYDNLLF